jgi:hypothetical protein
MGNEVKTSNVTLMTALHITPTGVAGTVSKAAFSVANGDCIFTDDGLAVVWNSGIVKPPVVRMSIGSYWARGGGGSIGSIRIKRIRYWPYERGRVQLRELTT